MNKKNPRQEIEEAVAAGDLQKLLLISGMLHGHFCPFSALGVKAGARAMRELNAASMGMEKLIAIVETNSCFSDGIQIVTGCTFGNNALIFFDYGKTAFTLARRSGEGFRVSVRVGRVLEKQPQEATELFDKVVARHAGSKEEEKRLSSLWTELSFKILKAPDEEIFNMRKVEVKIPSYARIFTSLECSICGESVMEPRIRMKEGEPVCLACSNQEYYQLTGDGIASAR